MDWKISEIFAKMKPDILDLISSIGGGSGPFAPSPHDLTSTHHSGSLGDSQAPQFLKTDGSRDLLGNLAVSAGVTIDGVDVSELSLDFDTHQMGSAAEAHLGGVGIHNHQSNPAGGLLDHSYLTNLTGADVHTDLVHIGVPRTISAVHTYNPSAAGAPFALGANAIGQTVTGLRADQLNKSISAGVGLSGGGALTADRALAVDLAYDFNWTGTHHFADPTYFDSTVNAQHLLPQLTDTYDIGSSVLLWRKGWLSELDTILFAKNTITLLGGWLVVGPNEGALPADVLAADTQIDFGQSMTVGHFVLFRGNLKVEYMQVGSLVSGTLYNVTRNLDGSGANDWPAGAPYSVLGTTGSGRIELNAYDSPRISILEQGATYNAQTERIRIGDLAGWQGAGKTGYGQALGSYSGGEYMYWSPADGMVIEGTVRAKAGFLRALTVDGLLSLATTGELRAGTTTNGIRLGYLTDGYYLRGVGGGTTQVEIRASDGRLYAGGGNVLVDVDGISIIGEPGPNPAKNMRVAWYAETAKTNEVSAIVPRLINPGITQLSFYVDGAWRMGLSPLGLTVGNINVTTSISRAGEVVGAYHKLDIPLTSTAWDGDAYSSMGPTLIDLSAVFGVPAGVQAVTVRLSCRDSASATTNNVYVGLAPTNTAGAFAVGCSPRGLPNDWYTEQDTPCGCNADGDIYITVAASGAGTMDIDLRITGYYL